MTKIVVRDRLYLSVDELKALAIRGLVQMFDPEKQLFCFRLNQVGDRLVREGISRRYTIMSLLGLYQLELSGQPSPINIKTIVHNLINDSSWIDNGGDVGLLLWLCALAAPDDLEHVCFSPQIKTALTLFRDARERRTMELAWLLTGLAHAVLARPEKRSDLAKLSTTVYHLLKENQGPSGIFGHLGRSRTISGIMRSRIGSFADQVYPIYAFARFAQAYQFDEALKLALQCGDAICALQGSLGQWWWHYDSGSGKVVQRYPVYSVHQHGMAPLALYALGEVSKRNFFEPIRKGLRWIVAGNELESDLRDEADLLVWRCIFPANKYRASVRDLARFVSTQSEAAPNDLRIRKECRPYELGWLLYAFSSRHERDGCCEISADRN